MAIEGIENIEIVQPQPKDLSRNEKILLMFLADNGGNCKLPDDLPKFISWVNKNVPGGYESIVKNSIAKRSHKIIV